MDAFDLARGIEWQEAAGHRLSKLILPEEGQVGFTQLATPTLGIQFTNRVSHAALTRRSNLTNGSGVALGDTNGDGLCDVYFCRLEGDNELYLNQGGWRFQLAPNANGAAAAGHLTRGAAFADVNGDGSLDLLLTTFRRGTLCLMNDGKGQFTDATVKAGLESRASGTTLALGDVDRDGDLDLYVANFGELALLRDGGSFAVRQVGGKSVVTGQHASRLKIVDGKLIELGEPDAFYLNDGLGVFQRVPWGSGRFVRADGQPLAEPLDFERLDFVARAREISVPVLLLHSDDDGFVPSDASRALATIRPDIVQLEVFEVARHTKLWNYDRARWERVVGAWLGALSPTTSPEADA